MNWQKNSLNKLYIYITSVYVSTLEVLLKNRTRFFFSTKKRNNILKCLRITQNF